MIKRVVAGVAALLIGGGAALAGPAAANADGSGSGGSSTDHPSGPSADELTAAEIADALAQLNADLSDEGMSDAGLQHNGVAPAGAIDVAPGG